MVSREGYEAYKKKRQEQERQGVTPAVSKERREELLKGYNEWKARTGRMQQDLTTRMESLAESGERFSRDYTARFGTRNGTDGGKYLGDATKRYQSAREQKKLFDTEADSILEALDQYGEYFDQDWADSIRDYLGNVRTDQDNMLLDYAADSRYWAQFGNEEGYLRYLNPEKYGRQDRQAQYAANNQRIEELKKQKAAGKEPASGYLTGGSMPQSSPYGAALQAPEKKKEDPIDDEISRMETWNRNYERGNGEYSKVIDDYAGIAERDDFEAVSVKRDYGNPTKEDLFAYDRSASEGSLALSNGGYFDDLGNIVDRDGNIVQLADGGKIHDRLGLYLSATEEDKTEAYKLLSASNGSYTNTWANLIQTGDEGSWNQLSENEVAIYYYLLNNDGQETADKYLDDMKVELNRRQTQWEAQEHTRVLNEANALEKVMLNVATVPAQLLGGAVGFADDAINLIQGKDINPYSSRHALSNFGGTIREARAAELETATNGAAIPFVNYTVGDLYQAGMSMVDMGVGGKLGPGTYMALMGMGSASAEAKKLYEQGASNAEIAWGGALAGAAEMIFEKVSIDKLIDIKDPKTGWDIVKNILIQGGVEASEEGLTEIANTITNALVMTDRSDWARLVEENNGDEFAAFKAKVADVGKAALGGFFSGMGSGGTHSAGEYIGNQVQSAQTGQYIDEHLYGSDALMALAEEVAGYAPPKLQGRLEAQSGKLHDAVYDGNGSRGKAAGKLYGTVRTAITQQNQADIAKGLQELEGPEGKRFTPRQARAIAEAAAASMNGEKLTERQQKTLDRFQSDSSVRDVVMEVAGGEQATRLDAFHAAIATDNAKTFRGGAQPASQGATQTAPRAAEQADVQMPGNVYGTEKTPSQGRYEVSDSGSAQLLHTGEPVSIRSVAEIRDGKMTLELKDGRKVSAEEISYANEDEALVYEAVAEMGVKAEAANVLLEDYSFTPKVNGRVYAKGMQDAYQYGVKGYPASELEEGTFTSQLTPIQRMHAYDLGKSGAIAKGISTVAKNATTDKTNVRRMGRVKGIGITIAELNKAFNVPQQKAYKILSTISEVTGIDVVLYRSKVGPDGKLTAGIVDGIDMTGAQGAFSFRNDKIYIDVNAGLINGAEMSDVAKYSMLRTFSHEFIHFIEKHNAVEYENFRDLVFETMRKNGGDPDSLIEDRMRKDGNPDRERASREVVAEAMTDILPQSHFVENLAQKHRTLFEKLHDKLREFAKRIRDYFDSIGMNTSAEAAILKETVGDSVRYTEDIVKMFDRIAEQAVEHYQAQATAKKNTAPEGGVMYQTKNGLSNSEISGIQGIGRASVNAFTSQNIKATESLAKRYWTEMGVKSPFFRAWFGDWRINDATPIQIADQRGYTRGVQHNEDTGWDINVSGQVFSETRNHTDSYNVAARPYLPYINDIVNKAILLDSYGVDPAKLKSHNSLLMHSLYAVADIGNGQEVLKLYVEEMNNPNADNTTKRSYQLQNIEKYHPAAKGSQKASPVSAASGTIKTIADLFAYVNQKDSSFIPNPVSKVVNADGTPKEMYHGTSNAGFRVFDTYGGKFGLFGKGSYFTDNPEVAESYTRKGKGQEPGVYGVYLNIKNPLDMDAKANLSAWKKAFKSADLDVSYLEGIATNEDAFRKLKENLSDEGYIRWEAEEIVTSIIEGMGYDGITHVGGGRFGSKDGPKHRVYIAFEPEQIKSSIENIGTFDGSNPDIRYQERTSTLTSRDILANALETVAQNEDERRALQKYRANIQKTVALEEEVTKSRSELRELRAKKGKTQAEKGRMEQLQNAIAKAEADIKNYDSTLLKLEAAKPVKDMLTRERTRAQRMIRENHKERASVTKQRAIVEKQVKDLTKMIANPTKDAHVPTVLHEPLQELFNSLDFSSKQRIGGGEATVRDLMYTRALNSIRTAISDQRTAMDGVEDGTFALDVPPKILELIDDHVKAITKATKGLELTNNRVYEMGSEELKELAKLLTTINTAVRNIDKLHMEGAKARVSELAESTVREMGQRKPVKGEDGGGLMWANYTPTYAFERMGTAATQILDGLKQGQAKMARTVDGVLKFATKTYDAKEVKAWQEEIHTVKLESGETVKLSTAQIMSFYCLSNRNQGVGHLTGGGIRVDTIGEGMGKIVQSKDFVLTVEDINQINGLLGKRQLEVAKAMQKYMQDVGGRLGNEISMARWGFMQMTEENYFPVKSHSNSLDAKAPGQEKANLFALLNKSFTKSTKENANNVIVVSSIFDVFADHMAEMAEYNAFALPLVDAMKWYNYRRTTHLDGTQIETVGVKKSLNDTLGTAAGKYFIDLMMDINGSQKGGRHEDIMGKLLSYSKAAAVGWNLRVAIQQPTAILRASLYLDMPDLARGSLRIGTKELVKEMQQYSGIALWKSLGYYDLNVSRSVREQIKGNTNLVDTFNEWGMWLPGKVDEITWARIWAACKSKVSRTQNLKGEALLKETAKLFDDVVYHTQVVDSVLTKSYLMRDKTLAIKELTSFMSEPTLSVNILMSAFQDYRQGKTNWEKAKRTFAICFKGYALSAMANALATSLMDAIRDDDEYEEFWEKYKQALLGENLWDGNLFSELNPLEKVVSVRDVLSAIKGHDVKNQYAELIQSCIDLVNDIKKYLEGKGSITEYGVIYNALKVLGNFTGAAPANLARELVTIWNNTFGKLSGKKIHRYQTGVRDGIHNAFDAGTLTREEAIRELVLAQEAENEDEAYFQVKKWETGEDSKYDGLYEALEKNEGVDAAMKELTDHGVKEKDAVEAVRDKLKEWYTDPESEIRLNREETISRLEKYTDMGSDEIQALVKKWDMELEAGFTYSELREQYVDGNISEKEAISYMQKYGGKTKEEAQDQMEDWTKNRFFDGEISVDKAAKVLTNHCGWEKADAENKVRYWDFKRSHPDLYVDDAWMEEYDIEIRESGIALEIFIAYRNKVKSITGEGKKDRRMAVIDSLPITDEQKDAIYFAEGWAISTLHKAPWH